MIYENNTDNRAYIEGYVRGIQATGLDWAKARVALEEAKEIMDKRLAAKDRELSKLRGIIHEKETKITELESEILAHKIAWRHRHEE